MQRRTLVRSKLLSGLECGRLDYIVRQFADEGCSVIRVDVCIMRSSRHRDVRKAFVNQVCMDVAIKVHHDTFRRDSLRTMTGDSVAVIEVPHLVGIEADGFAVVHLRGEMAVFVDALNGAKVAVGNA